uniref:RING-type domain-containing protein n=1 Tax=Oryza meridionalis TaxID=40149 RepID=A0A0E0C093_9ORYZ
MRANCCIAAKERSQPHVASSEVSAYKIRNSPSWSFRQSSGNIQQELKSGSIAPTKGHPNDDNLSYQSRSVKWQKSDSKMKSSKYLKAECQEINNFPTNIFSMFSAVQSTSSTSTIESITRKAHRSPGHQLCRQNLDNKVHSFKSFNESYLEEGRPSSSMPSVYSKDLIAGGSHGEPSQRERWPVDNDLFGHVITNRTRSNAPHSTSLAPGQEVCKLCSKQLKEQSTWNAHELAIVVVLFCGHSYHANCLDGITIESEKYDPLCPVCTHDEKYFTNLYGKQDSKIKNKVSKSVITDIDIDRSSKHRHKSLREPRLDTRVGQQGERDFGKGSGENSLIATINLLTFYNKDTADESTPREGQWPTGQRGPQTQSPRLEQTSHPHTLAVSLPHESMQVGPTPPVAHADAAGGGARGPAGSRGVSRETGSLGPHPTPASRRRRGGARWGAAAAGLSFCQIRTTAPSSGASAEVWESLAIRPRGWVGEGAALIGAPTPSGSKLGRMSMLRFAHDFASH